MKSKILVMTIACAMAFTFAVRAEQGGFGHYIPGEYLDFSGVPPNEPGPYFGNYFMDYGNATVSAGKELPFGGIFAAGANVNVKAEAPVIVYAYPFNFHNITFSSGIYPPWIWVNIKVSATFDRNQIRLSAGREQSANGFGDIQISPVMACWTNGDFKLGGMFNVWAPSGTYTAGQLANPGLGYWTFEPMLAFSWLSTKIGTEFTVFPAFDFNTVNHNINYQSGTLFHMDATLAQHLPLFGGIIGAGASVNYLDQINGDSGSGARLGSFETQSVAVGPTVSYVHKLGKSARAPTLIVSGSWLPQIHTRNTTKGNFYWAKLTLAF